LNEWNQKEISQHKSDTLSPEDEEMLAREEIVMLMQGKNTYGDRVYCYLKLSVLSLRKLKDAIVNKEDFMPSDFGEVLAAGNGYPEPELRAEMAVKYGLMQTPKVEPKRPAMMQKPVWDE
jgi:hypothetical protein